MNGFKSNKKTHYDLINKYFKDDASARKGYYSSKDIKDLELDFNKRKEWKTYTYVLDKILEDEKEVKSVVDVGCGVGNFTLELVLRKRFKIIVGVDILKETIEVAGENKKYFADVEFLQGNLLQLPFKDKSFDLCVCLNVIHHMHKEDFSTAINELARITDKYLILEIRNKKFLFELWFYKVLLPKTYKNLPQYTNSINEVNDLMGKNGFKVKIIKSRIPFTLLSRRITIAYKRV